MTTYPKATDTVTAKVSGSGTVSAASSDTGIATVAVSGKTITITGVKAGSATVTVTYTEGSNKVEAKCTVTVKASNAREDKTTKLKDKSGVQLYVQDGDSYREAVYADYFTASKFFIKGDVKYHRMARHWTESFISLQRMATRLPENRSFRAQNTILPVDGISW